MPPSGVDPADGLTRFTERHLATTIAVVARAIPDPALAFDIASEAMARGHRAAQVQTPPPGDEHDELRCVLEAAEHVVAATLHNGRVPHAERHRARDCHPTKLTQETLAALATLGRAALDHSPVAQHWVTALRRQAPAPTDIRTIASSPLVRRPDAPALRPADGGPSA